jgi:uroporphyrinogen decarboxylase
LKTTGASAQTKAAMPFLEACFGRPHARVPVWMMRQAGRYLPEYRALREQHTFLEMCRRPEVAAAVTLQPLRRFDLDAAIIFSDILIFLPALGLDVDFPAGGPVVARPIAAARDIARLRPLEAERDLAQVYQAIRLCVQELAGAKPLIGFCGAPFTLACYAIEGGGSTAWPRVKAFIHDSPALMGRLLDGLADAAAAHLQAQLDAGADAVQIFDSWAGLLGRDDFERYSKPYLTRLVASARRPGAPVIVFARGVPAAWLPGIGADMYNLDARADLRDAYRVLKPAGVQGNLDPALLLRPAATAVAEAVRLVVSMAGVERYVFNLGHGVPPQTPPETIEAVVEAVHGLSV